jgi:serine/threonine protein kinase
LQPIADLEDGRRLEIVETIGKGSASSVHRAVLESTYGLRRTVAAKIFNAVASDDAEHVATAIAIAAQQGAMVRHPNVVATYDFVVWNGQPALLTELVEGVTLAALLERHGKKRLPLDLALFLGTEIAEALSAARIAVDEGGVHIKLLHLGLTPREVLLSWRGEVKVEGFGLDTARAGSSSVRSLRSVAGRANMMAPEVAAGERGDPRADVFSLGVIMRELFIGPRFPKGITNGEAIRLAREGYVQPICFQPHLPSALVAIMQRALQVDPEDRYPNATSLATELRRIALSMGVGDCRYFLSRTLDRDFNDGTDESTNEVGVSERS